MAGESGPVLSLTPLRDAPADPATSVLQGRCPPRSWGIKHVIDGFVDDPEWRMGLLGLTEYLDEMVRFQDPRMESGSG